ncbi:MAG: hypothetical protein JKY80_07060 [Mariprofundaceae bacterium]|nr:hypothetical protein [Mariprofundaceae bacterium]
MPTKPNRMSKTIQIETIADLAEVNGRMVTLKPDAIEVAKKASIYICKELTEAGKIDDAKVAFGFVQSWYDGLDEKVEEEKEMITIIKKLGEAINTKRVEQGKEFHSFGDKVDQLIKAKDWKEAKKILGKMLGIRPDDKGAKEKVEQVELKLNPPVKPQTLAKPAKKITKKGEVTMDMIRAKVKEGVDMILEYISQQPKHSKKLRRFLYANRILNNLLNKTLRQ